MTYGQCSQGLFGYASIKDWFNSIIESFPKPWSIGSDTHYGTEIFDGRGRRILSLWLPYGNPSARQKGDMTDREWAEYCCDSHWESETQWHLANAIVSARNALKSKLYPPQIDELFAILRILLMQTSWSDEANGEICCGGPDRRLPLNDPQVRKSLRS